MPMIQLSFPVLGSALPADHGYPLYAGVARQIPALHGQEIPVFIGPIQGQYAGNGLINLETRRSWLRLRLPVENIPQLLPLAGKRLEVDGHPIRLGVPQVRSLIPAASLIARLVLIKTKDRATDPDSFLAAARRQLADLDIQGEAAIPLVCQGPHAGQPRRRILRLKDKRVVGYSLQVTALTAEESLRLQEHGLGGRKKMGCGFFVAIRQTEN